MDEPKHTPKKIHMMIPATNQWIGFKDYRIESLPILFWTLETLKDPEDGEEPILMPYVNKKGEAVPVWDIGDTAHIFTAGPSGTND